MKIKLSKSQWQFVGKKAGWMKKADIVPAPVPLEEDVSGEGREKEALDKGLCPKCQKPLNESTFECNNPECQNFDTYNKQ